VRLFTEERLRTRPRARKQRPRTNLPARTARRTLSPTPHRWRIALTEQPRRDPLSSRAERVGAESRDSDQGPRKNSRREESRGMPTFQSELPARSDDYSIAREVFAR
jgi:hypothetical protein